MSDEKMNKKKTTVVTIGEDLTIYSVATLRETLARHAASATRLELDLSGVRRMDTAGYQLLALLRWEIEAGGGTLTMLRPSAEAASLLRLYGEHPA